MISPLRGSFIYLFICLLIHPSTNIYNFLQVSIFFWNWTHNELYPGKQKRCPQEAYMAIHLQGMKNKGEDKTFRMVWTNNGGAHIPETLTNMCQLQHLQDWVEWRPNHSFVHKIVDFLVISKILYFSIKKNRSWMVEQKVMMHIIFSILLASFSVVWRYSDQGIWGYYSRFKYICWRIYTEHLPYTWEYSNDKMKKPCFHEA